MSEPAGMDWRRIWLLESDWRMTQQEGEDRPEQSTDAPGSNRTR